MKKAIQGLTQRLAKLRLYALDQDSMIDRELAAYQAGFDFAEDLLEDTLAQAFVHTATGADLAGYEKLVGLAPREDMEDSARRALVLYRMGVAPMDFYPEGILASIRAAGMVAEITENIPGESLVVRCVEMVDTDTDLDRIKASVDAMLPAHLEVEFDIGELTWDQFDQRDPHWDKWDATGMTWADFDVNGHNIFPG